ncbi:MAG: CPBP family intramembrane metalloprotease [Acidobacteria bacterium]|nr:CPBP family intramembrane metalloprotease [Acidobacteriota bacterium]
MLLLVLAIPGLPISRWEDEFAGVLHLVAYEVIWWTLIFSILIYVRKIEARPLSSIGFRRLSPWDALLGLIAGLFMLAGIASIYYGLFPLLHLSEGQQLSEIAGTPLWWRCISVLRAAIGEEVLFRGYAIERGREVFGSLRIASTLSWLIFTIEHVSTWGWSHVLIAGFGGLLLTLLYVWRRSVWINIIAHFVVDGASVLVA